MKNFVGYFARSHECSILPVKLHLKELVDPKKKQEAEGEEGWNL
jgi:hypothetical protein